MRRSAVALVGILAIAACAHDAAAPETVDEKILIATVRHGNDAYKRKDYEEFLRLARRAAEMSPDNPDLQVRVARALVLSGRNADGLALLGRILTLGVAYDLDRKDWDPVRSDPAFARARDKVAANLQPQLAGDVVFTLPAPDILAEAIGWDEATRSFYVSSVHQRKILRIEGEGRVSAFIPEETEHWGLMGLQIDPSRRRLWVGAAAMPQVDGYLPADDGLAGILLVDLD